MVLIDALKEAVDVTYNISAAIIYTGGFFSHLTPSFYFRSRDFEDMICVSLNGSQLKRFRKSLNYFNARIVISIAVFIHFIPRLFIAAAANDSRATFLVDKVYPYHDACGVYFV